MSATPYAGLLPCPFCGCEDMEFQDSGFGEPPWVHITCGRCCTSSGASKTVALAVERWNTRPEAAEAISSLLKRVGELEGALSALRPHFEFLAGKPQLPAAVSLLELIDAALNSDASTQTVGGE